MSWSQVMGYVAALVGRAQVTGLQMKSHFFMIELDCGSGSGMFCLVQGWPSVFSGFGR